MRLFPLIPRVPPPSYGNAWHERDASHEHHLRFKRLVQVHRLTLGWLEALSGEWPESLNGHLQTLSQLSNLSGTPVLRLFTELLDDTGAEDVLSHLELSAWRAQACVASHLGTIERLQQISATQGALAAEEDWTRLRGDPHKEMRRLIWALLTTPFAHGALPLRATTREGSLELLQCPHQSAYPEIRAAADSLCALHAVWIQGFLAHLNPEATVTRLRGSDQGRCRLALGASTTFQ